MDTNQETGVSLDDVAALIEEDDDQAIEASEETTEEEIADSDDSEAEEEPQEESAADDSEDVEFEGKTYKVPKELKGALLRQQDYTQKTQELAQQRRQFEQQAQTFGAQQKLLSQQFDKAVELRSIDAQISQYKGIDWNALIDQDPVQAQKLQLAYQQLNAQRNEKLSELQQTQAQAQQLDAQRSQQMLQEQMQEVKRRIPNFDAKVTEKLTTVAREFGFSDDEIGAIVDARQLHVLHDAMQWRALQAAKPKAMQKVAEAPKVVKPQAPQNKQQQRARELDGRFRSTSGGKLNDLAAFIANS